MFEWLVNLDKQLLLILNKFHNETFDFIMYWASHKFTWIPFYAFLVYLIYRIKGVKSTIYSVLIVGSTIVVGESIAQITKKTIQRIRPCNDSEIGNYVHTVMDGCKESFSFVSAHALNSFSLAIVIIFILKKDYKWIAPLMIGWAILHSYTRIYLGVHYPGDIVCGATIGVLVGKCFSYAHQYFKPKISFFANE